MSGRKRAAMPEVADVHGAALSVVDVVTDDAPSVPPVPAGRLDVEHAQALTERIRLTAQTTRERLQRLAELVEQARAGEVADVLGYASWTAYLADVLGGQMRLDGADRRELVGYLTEQGMSTRAIAPIVGASPKTVARDAAAARVSGDTPAPVTGRDGKTYARREHVPSLPECPTCGATGQRCKRPSGHDAAEWHVEREDIAARACGCPDCRGWLRGRAVANRVREVAAEQPALEGMPEPIDLPVPAEPVPWLIITQTAAMAAGTQRVHQCSECGTVVVVSSASGSVGRLGACPACGGSTWWEQRFPVAGVDLATSRGYRATA